jgi:hypothetical protein
MNSNQPNKLQFLGSLCILHVWKKFVFSLLTFVKVRFSFLNFKTEQIISLDFSNRAFYLSGVVLKAVWSFSFVFILAESLKNYVNHKIENQVSLDFT